jgi:hypothetical protein
VRHKLPLITLLCLVISAGAAAPAWADHGQYTTFQDDALLLSAATRDQTLDQIKSLGDGHIRVNMYWRDIAPDTDAARKPDFDATQPDQYPASAWAPYDQLIAAARARHMGVTLTVSGPVPRWATRSHRSHVSRPSPHEFAEFMEAVGRRYRTRVNHWSIWNEPNHPDFLAPQKRHGHAVSGRLYRRLYRAGLRGLKASGNGSDTILFGETAPRGSKHDVAPLTFTRQALCLNRHYRMRRGHRCKKLRMDGFALHPYTTAAGPFFKPPNRNDVTIGVLGRLIRALDRAHRAGAIPAHVPLYLTEFGVQSTPDPFAGVGLQRQNEYRAIAEKIAWNHGRVKAFSQFLMDDSPLLPGDRFQRYSGFQSGLRFHGGKRKPAYRGFRLPLVARRRGHRVNLWGLVRPATGRTEVHVYRRRGRHGHWKPLLLAKTNRRGYWRTRTGYRRGSQYQARWTAPDGHTVNGGPIRAYRK